LQGVNRVEKKRKKARKSEARGTQVPDSAAEHLVIKGDWKDAVKQGLKRPHPNKKKGRPE
jgi:hypothetical protein